MDLSNCTAYEVLQEKKLDDIKSTGCLLRHKKSGARISLIPMKMRIRFFILVFVLHL